MSKRNRIFWGIFFLLAAVTVVTGMFNFLGQVSLWRIMTGALLLIVAVHSATQLNYGGFFIPVSVILILFRHELGLHLPFHPWYLVAAAVLLSIGLSLLFPSRRQAHWHDWDRHHSFGHDGTHHPDRDPDDEGDAEFYRHSTSENMQDNHPVCHNLFGASAKYLQSQALKTMVIRSTFGAVKVFFDNAALASQGATVDIVCSFGAVQLYVPRQWRVYNGITAILGGVDEKNRANAQPGDGPALTLRGTVTFGGVEIFYV